METKKNKTEKKSLLRKAEELRKSGKEKSAVKSDSHPVLTKVLVRLTTVITLALLATLVFIILSTHIKNTYFTEKKEIHEAMVTQQLMSVQELITQKYRYSDIITLKKSLGFSKSYSIVKFTGIIRAGIPDLSKIEFKISHDKKSIRLKVPKSEVLGNDIVDQAVFDEKRSLFVPITTQEIFEEIDSVRNSIAEEVVGEGLLEEADRDAHKVIMQMMYSMGFEAVQIEN